MVKPRIVRESCIFTREDSESIIESRIKATLERAKEVAEINRYKNLVISHRYVPCSDDDLQHSWTMKSRAATNWREALAECHWGNYAQYTVTIRDQDYTP